MLPHNAYQLGFHRPSHPLPFNVCTPVQQAEEDESESEPDYYDDDSDGDVAKSPGLHHIAASNMLLRRMGRN